MSTRPYTPTQESADDLNRRTVGRDRQLSILGERLRMAATSKARAHTLLVGPRGSGKTHLLAVALNRAASDPVIGAGIKVARVPEDAVGIIGYVALLREAASRMGLDIGQQRDAVALEQAILEAAGERTLVLVIENLDKVFAALGPDGQADLRSWVETSGQVLILAATPALFNGVRNRKMPWFGGFAEMPVEGLTDEDGRQLLTLLAQQDGQDDLAQALQSDWGAARVKAVSQLTAGSPRIWMVFFDCLTIEALDELIPAVEGLVEGLVPYYQDLLWSLPGNQQAIVKVLAEGAAAAFTVAEIAERTGISQQTAGKALTLLKANRWVSDKKIPSGDQRRTFYELREPMLRHHLQWRAREGEPLGLIVGLLRETYAAAQLRRQLSKVSAGSPSERYLAESLRDKQLATRVDVGDGTPSTIRELAREWIFGSDPARAEAGVYAELCAELASDTGFDTTKLLATRARQHVPSPLANTVDALVSQAAISNDLVELLMVAIEQTKGYVSAHLGMISSSLLFNQTFDHPDQAQAIIDDRLKPLAVWFEDNPDVNLTLADALFNLTWRETDPATIQAIVDTQLTPLADRFPDNPDINLPLAKALFNLTAEETDPATIQAIVDTQLKPLANRFPDNPDINLALAGALFNLTFRETDPAIIWAAIYQELKPLAARFPDDPDINLPLAKTLAYQAIRHPDQFRVIIDTQLAPLAVRFPDNRDINLQLAGALSRRGDWQAVLRLYESILKHQEAVWGAKHPATKETRQLVELYRRVVEDDTGLIELLDRARSGDHEALMRLPAELQMLVGW